MRSLPHTLLMLLVLALCACSDVTSPPSDQAKRLKVQGPSRDYYIDWYDCTSWDSGESWSCVYSGTSSGGGPTVVSGGQIDHSPVNCSQQGGYCGNLEWGGGSSYNNDPVNVPVAPINGGLRSQAAACLTNGLCIPPDQNLDPNDVACSDAAFADLCEPSTESGAGAQIFHGKQSSLVGCPSGNTFFDTHGTWVGEPAVYQVGAKKIRDLSDIPGLDGLAVYAFVFRVNGVQKYVGVVEVDCDDGTYIGLGLPR